VVKSHLIKRGFKKNYTIWTSHGEINDALLEVNTGGVGDDNSHDQDDGVFDGDDHGIDDDNDFDFEELLRHVEPHVLNSMGTDRGLDNMKILEKSLREPLYNESNGCGKEFTQLRVMLELLKLKASHGWSDNSFSDLLSLLAKLLPKPNTLPTSTYRVKKLICPLSLGVEKIHACPNHCILYHKEHEFKTKCLVCGVSRYKRNYNHGYVDTMKNKNKKIAISPESVNDKTDSDKEDKKKTKIPTLVKWYLPVIDHLKHVFSNPRDVELVHWHSEKRRKNDEEIRHPADGTQWKNFDLQYKAFGSESRNIRFALSTDRMNPFGENRTVHSTWPVILVMYNFLTWLCHKRKYLMLSILIQGLKQAGIDIVVFLEPLMEDMVKLWNEGVRMCDQYQQEYFTLYAIIFVCIHDAP
jgi:hypothetical protein